MESMLQVEVWPPAAPRFVSAPFSTPSAPAPADLPTDSTARPSSIIYEDGSAPNHRSPIQAGAAAADSAGRPQSASTAASAQPASVMPDSSAVVSYHDADGLAASERPPSSERQDRDHVHPSQQHGSRADATPARPASAQSSVDGSGSKQAGVATAEAGLAGRGPAVDEVTHEAKHEQLPQQKQQHQSPHRRSPSRAAGSDTSPDTHIG